MKVLMQIFAALFALCSYSIAAVGQDAQSNSAAPAAQPSAERSAPHRLRPGADPWVIEHNGKYYWSQSNNAGGEICLWESDSLDTMGERRAVWKAPRRGPVSRELWAPEVHFFNGRFYIYFAADNGENKNHLSYVLVSETDDPFSKYELHGPFYTGDDPELKLGNRWAIDSTVFVHKEKPYLIWSGWEDDRDVQYLYIAPLNAERTQTTAPRVKICHNADYLWERTEERRGSRGLAEGPETLQAPNGRVFLSYSCGASWLPTYKVGLLELVGDDPLDPQAWKKFDKPWFERDEFNFGVGHGSFARDQDGLLRYIYHAKTRPEGGWNDRTIFWRNVDFDDEGFPVLRY